MFARTRATRREVYASPGAPAGCLRFTGCSMLEAGRVGRVSLSLARLGLGPTSVVQPVTPSVAALTFEDVAAGLCAVPVSLLTPSGDVAKLRTRSAPLVLERCLPGLRTWTPRGGGGRGGARLLVVFCLVRQLNPVAWCVVQVNHGIPHGQCHFEDFLDSLQCPQ